MEAWICTCGFRNRAQNAVCGGTGPLGCNANRTPMASQAGAQAYDIEEIPSRCPGTLRLVTYNVCFHPAALEIRLQAIAQILESVDADVVALQEMTDQILEILSLHISKEWQVFKQSPSHVEDLFVYETSYFTCLLVQQHFEVVDVFSLRFSITAMARGLQYVILKWAGECRGKGQDGNASEHRKVVVATSHLESPLGVRSGQETREHQLEEGGRRLVKNPVMMEVPHRKEC